ncbi:thioredoxin-disulfide reductase [bacterium]|nr:thioredoxin-disulfide reductase [bacterium]
MNNKTKKVVIIGSGPAGLTAGLYAARSNLEPIIFSGPKPGGQLVTTTDVENWPGEKKISGVQLVTNMRDHAKHFGCEFIAEKITKIDTSSRPFTITTDKENIFKSESIIIATGAYPRKLHVEGEDTYWTKGVSTCAVCDGSFYKDKHVVIVGGGDTGMENASFLRRFTDKVTIIHIRETLSASPLMQKRVLDDPKITILYNSTVTKILGDKKQLQKIVITNQKTDQEQTIKADGLFVSIGMVPNTSFLKGIVDLNTNGYIQIQQEKNSSTNTSIEGIFAAGDVCDYLYRQAITASGMGCMAALDVERYLAKESKIKR